ncbi:MAG: MFS transporter [Jatrophihabitans sp.]|uniref:MFS transporter n=1 Tax=Jatrophihabitans sp. TaxID=1932789 RepID=UPI003913CB69
MTGNISRATRGTYLAFIGAGFAFASWAARIPQVRDGLHLSAADLGLVLLSLAAGALIALPLAGAIVHRFNSRRTVATMSLLLAVGLVTVAIGYRTGVAGVVIGLFVVGFANGAWDVAMNVQGALVERQRGRSIMPRFHAGFSVGTVAGALVATLMVAVHVSVTVHLLGVAGLIAATMPLAVQDFLPDVNTDVDTETTPDAPAEKSAETPRAATALTRWLEPRTLLIGVVVLAFAFTEGSGNDWISVALIDGYGVPAAVGSLGFAAFLTAMTTLRWFGTGLLDRYGRVTVLRGLSLVAIAGLALFVFSPWTPLAFAGALLWGAGASLGFPVGMSAAADDPTAAAGRVSVVASIGYCAFLGGPPLIGFVGSHDTVLHALLAVAVLLSVAMTLVGALRPLPGAAGS